MRIGFQLLFVVFFLLDITLAQLSSCVVNFARVHARASASHGSITDTREAGRIEAGTPNTREAGRI